MAFGKATAARSTAAAPAVASAPAGKPTFGRKPAAPINSAKGAIVIPKSSGRRISLKPSDQQHGGILDDVDVDITSLMFTTWDYNGQQEPGLALCATFTEADGKETVQYYSAGKLEHMVPSTDGRGCEAAVGSNKTGLNDNCNAALFLKSLGEMGFPEDKMEEAGMSTEIFEGTNIHLNAQAQKKRAGLQNQDDKQRTILLVTRINSFPWEAEGATPPAAAAKVAGKGKAALAPAKAAAGKANAAPATNGDTALDDEAAAAILQVLEAEGGTVAKKTLGMKVFRVLGQSPNRSAILNLVASDDFLTQEGAPWAFDGANVTAA